MRVVRTSKYRDSSFYSSVSAASQMLYNGRELSQRSKSGTRTSRDGRCSRGRAMSMMAVLDSHDAVLRT